jgi:hypothetical protein
MSPKAFAGFDALYIVDALARFAGGAGAVELHLFAYLACLVSVYAQNDPDEWGYEFVATPSGAPYAETLADEADRLQAAGRLLQSGPLIVLSAAGAADLSTLSRFATVQSRRRFLDAGCSSATLMPLPAVTNAIAREPGLQQALTGDSPKELLRRADLILVDEQFSAVAEVVATANRTQIDLLGPTTLWLSYLIESSPAAA